MQPCCALGTGPRSWPVAGRGGGATISCAGSRRGARLRHTSHESCTSAYSSFQRTQRTRDDRSLARSDLPDAAGDDDDDGAENPLSAARASARAEATFRASVRHVLQREVAYLAPLGRADFARLCQLLDLPLHVGATWQSRVLRLQAQLHLQPQGPCLAPADGGGDGGGECAANAMSAFCADLATERARSREGGDWHEPETKAKMRHFGRQTVWCTVALLRKVLEEASWPAGGRQLSSAQAEAKLASLAVAAIGGGCSAIEREATGQAADPATTCGGEGVSLV